MPVKEADLTRTLKMIEAIAVKEGVEQEIILYLLRSATTVTSPSWLAHKLTDEECEEFMSERRWVEKSRKRQNAGELGAQPNA